MARDFGRVKVAFWDNPEIRSCSPVARMVALYLLTSQHTNAIGLFRLPFAYMQDDTGLTKDEIETAFSELRHVGFVEWCERVPWVWIRNYLKHNAPENANVWRKCLKELQSVPPQCLISVEAAAEKLFEISLEPRMRKGTNALTDVEASVLEGYRNRIERVVVKENNHGAGLTPLSYPCPSPCPLPEPNPEPSPNHSSTPPPASPTSSPLVSDDPSSQPKGRRGLPDEFPDHVAESWAVEHWSGQGRADLANNILTIRAQFRDHHAAKGTRAADWPATWRTWVRNAIKFEKPPEKQRISAHDKGTLGLVQFVANAERSADATDSGGGAGTARNPLPANGHGPAQMADDGRRFLVRLPALDGSGAPGSVPPLPHKP